MAFSIPTTTIFVINNYAWFEDVFRLICEREEKSEFLLFIAPRQFQVLHGLLWFFFHFTFYLFSFLAPDIDRWTDFNPIEISVYVFIQISPKIMLEPPEIKACKVCIAELIKTLSNRNVFIFWLMHTRSNIGFFSEFVVVFSFCFIWTHSNLFTFTKIQNIFVYISIYSISFAWDTETRRTCNPIN